MDINDVYQEYWQSRDLDSDERVAVEDFLDYLTDNYYVELRSNVPD